MMFVQPKRKVNRVFIHCSASDENEVGNRLLKMIQFWHLARGFNGIGYHYIIDKEGAVITGRYLEKIPAAQKGHNTGTIAICVHGLNFDPHWHVGKQSQALYDFCNQINLAYSGVIAFWPHNAVSNRACPVFDIDKLLDLDKWRRMK